MVVGACQLTRVLLAWSHDFKHLLIWCSNPFPSFGLSLLNAPASQKNWVYLIGVRRPWRRWSLSANYGRPDPDRLSPDATDPDRLCPVATLGIGCLWTTYLGKTSLRRAPSRYLSLVGIRVPLGGIARIRHIRRQELLRITRDARATAYARGYHSRLRIA